MTSTLTKMFCALMTTLAIITVGIDAYYSSFFTCHFKIDKIVFQWFQNIIVDCFEFFDDLNRFVSIDVSWSFDIVGVILWFAHTALYIGFISTVIVLTAPIAVCLYNLMVNIFMGNEFYKDMQDAFTKRHFASDRIISDDSRGDDNEIDSHVTQHGCIGNSKSYRNNSYNIATQDTNDDMINQMDFCSSFDDDTRSEGALANNKLDDVFDTTLTRSASAPTLANDSMSNTTIV